MRIHRLVLLCGLAAACAIGPHVAMAQSGNFELELNSAADVPEGCRLTYVATNSTSVALDQTSYEVAVFDDTGLVTQILVLAFGKMPLNKTRVVQFDINGVTCAKISRILVNDPVECKAGDADQEVCRSALIASSRSPTIQFGL